MMHLCGKRIFATKPIISRLRKLFRRSRQVSVREAPASDENLVVVGGDQLSQTAESPDSEPRPEDAAQPGEPRLPPGCDRLRTGDIKISAKFPTRAGAFTDVWEGSLDGDRVVIKSYRLYSTADPTPVRIVRFYWYL